MIAQLNKSKVEKHTRDAEQGESIPPTYTLTVAGHEIDAELSHAQLLEVRDLIGVATMRGRA